MTVAEYLKKLLAVEEYSFTLEEVLPAVGKNVVAVRSELARLSAKKEILNLRQGFYLILPPRYSKAGKLPIQLYAEKLFKFLDRRYYLGFYTAAKLHGASHQQAQRDYVMTEAPKLKDIEKNGIRMRFMTTACWPPGNILSQKSDAGPYRISSKALTIADLVHYQTKLGGLNRMLATIEELAEELEPEDLAQLLHWYPHKSTLQRMGILLQYTGTKDHLQEQLFQYLKQTDFFPVLLSPKSHQKPGAAGNRWKVDININLESDL